MQKEKQKLLTLIDTLEKTIASQERRAISKVRVTHIDGQFIINPTFTQLEKADINIIVAEDGETSAATA